MNTIHIVVQVASFATIIVALSAGFGLVALAVITCATTLMSTIIKLAVLYLKFPAEVFPNLRFDMDTWKQIRSFSLWNSLNEFATEGTAQLDRLLVAILLTSALVTPYSLVITLSAAIFLLAEPITDTFLPIAATRHSMRDRLGMTSLLVRGTRVVTLATLPTTVVIVFFGEDILDLWIGEEYTDIDSAVIWFTAVNFFFSTFLWTSLSLLTGRGEVRRIFKISVIEITMALALILLLVPMMELPGLALAGLVANVVTGIFLIIPAACRDTFLSPAKFVAQNLLPTLAAATPGCLTAWAFLRWAPPTGWYTTVMAIGISFLVTLGGLLLFNTSRRERARYYITIRRGIGVG